jgi:hypothetical protein
VDKTTVFSKLNRRDTAGFGHESASKPWIDDYLGGDDFDKERVTIDNPALDRTHVNLAGLHTCTAMGSLFSSTFES